MTDAETDEMIARAKSDPVFRQKLLDTPELAFQEQGVAYDEAELQSAIDKRDKMERDFSASSSGGLQVATIIGYWSSGRRGGR